MEHIREQQQQKLDEILDDLERMRQFEGPPGAFWQRFLAGGVQLSQARFGILLVQGEEGEGWRRMCVWPAGGPQFPKSGDIAATIESIAARSTENGQEWQRAADGSRTSWLIMGVRLDLGEATAQQSVAVFLADTDADIDPDENILRLKLIAGMPNYYQMSRMLKQAEGDVVQFAEALDLMVLMNRETRYMGAAMTFCNEISSRYKCQRVSLGWLKKGYIRLQALSHMEKFEKKMDAVQSLEAAMEEAYDQDEEVVWPRPEGSTTVTRSHEIFAREQGADNILSLPIRLDGEAVGILFCERAAVPFSEIDARGIRVFCDQAARRLDDLRRTDRWFGARWAASLKKGLAWFFGIEQTFAKLLGVLISIALLILLFGKWEYRVEAPFILKTDDLMYVPAAFDGYIDEVNVEIGDRVEKGQLLLTLDTGELLLEESSALANQSRYQREAEKARAENALAEMQIAQALKAQAEAQLAIVRFSLANAVIKAPFDGFIVEGDLKKMLGAPVKKGDILFKVALVDKMYAEVDVDERDIHEVGHDFTGEIAFVSRPKLKFPIIVEKIDPLALSKDKGNIFTIRGRCSSDIPSWWRPGMSGIAKINIGQRNLLWIFSHRTVDFLRLFFWW